MVRRSKANALPEWAREITSLRERLGINQAELARRMECSAMTISRWERGLLQPSAEHFIQLGNLGDKSESWFFWEMAGVQPAKMIQALVGSSRKKKRLEVPHLEMASAGAAAIARKMPEVIGLPLLKAVVGAHGVPGDRRNSLRTIPASEIVGAPATWCPNPAYTSLVKVKGHSMEPLIRNGDIVAVDSFQIERADLYGKIVIASNEQKGLCVSRFSRYDTLDVLEGENRQYEPVILSKATGWRIVARVLWWISAAP
jgi:phage repressor protein C with HTH and peptisase S24 domain